MSEWSDSFSGHWDAAVRGNSSLRESMNRALRIECAMLGGVPAALALIDVEKYYASMDLLLLYQKANERVFPTRVLLHSFSQYLAPRSILSHCMGAWSTGVIA